MTDLGRTLIGVGVLLVVAGLVVTFWGRLGLPRLPGDFVLRRGGTTIFLPIATSVILSVALTLILNLLLRRKP